MKEAKIHVFDPVIYPVKLYIYTNPTNTSLKNDFCIWNEEECSEYEDGPTKASVLKDIVSLKSNGEYGILISIFNKKLSISDIAHESTHAARIIWEWLGEDVSGVESDAYLVGWIAKCIYEVIKNK